MKKEFLDLGKQPIANRFLTKDEFDDEFFFDLKVVFDEETKLVSLKEFANEIGAVLIFDEITSGFRMCAGGIHLNYAINPDMAIFAKSMANGYAMAAVIGTEKVMSAAQSTFISSTNWTERIGPVAAIASIEKYINENVANHIIKVCRIYYLTQLN